MTTRLAHMPEAPTPHDQPMLTAPFGPCNAAHRRGLCDLNQRLSSALARSHTRSVRNAEAARAIRNADRRPTAQRPHPFPPRPHTDLLSLVGGWLLPTDSRAWDWPQAGAWR